MPRFLVFVLAGLLSVSAGTTAARTTADAVYTKPQAKKGEKLYRTHCLTCHDKQYFKPVLDGWQGQSLGTFFEVMAATMPESNPGSLPDREYVSIIAYILSLSRYPSGADALDGNLDDIVIQSP